MTINGRIWRALAVLVFTGVILGFAVQSIGYAAEIRSIRGIVEYATANTITVKNRFDNVSGVHDIIGVQVVDVNENVILETGSSLIGKRVDILYRDGKVVFVKIFPVVPE